MTNKTVRVLKRLESSDAKKLSLRLKTNKLGMKWMNIEISR